MYPICRLGFKVHEPVAAFYEGEIRVVVVVVVMTHLSRYIRCRCLASELGCNAKVAATITAESRICWNGEVRYSKLISPRESERESPLVVTSSTLSTTSPVSCLTFAHASILKLPHPPNNNKNSCIALLQSYTVIVKPDELFV